MYDIPQAGNYVKDDVWHALIVVISNAPDLQGYTVRSLYRAFQTSSEQVLQLCSSKWGKLAACHFAFLS